MIKRGGDKKIEPSAEVFSLPEGMITDYITGMPVKETEKEKVRQEVIRQLVREYGIAPENMETDFAVKVEGRRKKIDIAIFEIGKPHRTEHLQRAIICRASAKSGKKAVIKIRDFAQAERDLAELKAVMLASDTCDMGFVDERPRTFLPQEGQEAFRDSLCPIWRLADGRRHDGNAGHASGDRMSGRAMKRPCVVHSNGVITLFTATRACRRTPRSGSSSISSSRRCMTNG